MNSQHFETQANTDYLNQNDFCFIIQDEMNIEVQENIYRLYQDDPNQTQFTFENYSKNDYDYYDQSPQNVYQWMNSNFENYQSENELNFFNQSDQELQEKVEDKHSLPSTETQTILPRKKTQSQETKNIFNQFIPFFHKQIQLKINNFNLIPYTNKSLQYFNDMLLHGYNNLKTEKERQEVEQKLLEITTTTFIQYVQNSKNLETSEILMKYLLGIQVIIQNPGKFSSIKDANDHGLEIIRENSQKNTT